LGCVAVCAKREISKKRCNERERVYCYGRPLSRPSISSIPYKLASTHSTVFAPDSAHFATQERSIFESASPSVTGSLYEASQQAICVNVSRKRKHPKSQYERCTLQRVKEHAPAKPFDETKFIELPSEDQVKHCYREFYDATHPSHLVQHVCGVCAHEVNAAQHEVSKVYLSDIPNSHRLRPAQAHEAHDLYLGLLLEMRLYEGIEKTKTYPSGAPMTRSHLSSSATTVQTTSPPPVAGRKSWSLSKKISLLTDVSFGDGRLALGQRDIRS
jgi:hypothetical protein